LAAGDGWVLGGKDYSIRLYDAESGTQIGCPLRGEKQINSVAFSPDGSLIAAGDGDFGDEGTIRLYNAATGDPFGSPLDVDSRVNSVAYSPDGTMLAAGLGFPSNSVLILDAQSGEIKSSLRGHSASVNCVDFSPDGLTIASGSGSPSGNDNSVRVWDVKTGKQLWQLNVDGGIYSVAFSMDGSKIAVAFNVSDDDYDFKGGGVKIFSTQGSAGFVCQSTLRGHTDLVWSVCFSPDGTKIVSGSSDKTVLIWDAASGEQLCSLKGHSKDNEECTCTHGQYAYQYKANPDCPVSGHSDYVRSVAWSPDGTKLASGSNDKTVRIWEAATGKQLWQLRCDSEVLSVAYSPDGTKLAAGLYYPSNSVVVFNTQTNEQICSLNVGYAPFSL